ncbi:MAG: RDD family protein [Verrucomicrobiae bacterium]|nr:RDD family protein [Verrucomicrobiae bacterium]
MKTTRLVGQRPVVVLGVAVAISLWPGVESTASETTDRFAPGPGAASQVEESGSKSSSSSESSIRYLGDLVKVGADAVVRADEKVNDLVVVMGNVSIEGDVGGDAVVVHGNAEVNGKIGGDCVVVCGELKLGPRAQIGGETFIAVGRIDRHPEAKLASAPKEFSFEKWITKLDPLWKWIKHGLLLCRPLPPGSGLAWFFVGLFFLVYLIIAGLMPQPVNHCLKVLQEQSVVAFVVGVVALVLFGPLTLLLVASGIGLLAVPFLALALGAAVLVGKTATLQFIGSQLLRRVSSVQAPESLIALLVGAAVVAVLYMVPILGCVLWGVLFCIGLGAALVAIIRSFRVTGPLLATSGEGPQAPSSATAQVPGSPTQSCTTAGPQAPETQAGPPVGILHGTPPVNYACLPRAGFWLRFAATLLDFILLGWLLAHLDGLGVLAWIGYHICMWTWKGATIGGIIIRIKIVREDGRELDFGTAFVRGLVAVFSFLALGLGFFWAGWTREKRSWHDKVAGTIVVKVPQGVPMV